MNNLFEFQRLWDYWPHLRNVKTLKELFYQTSAVKNVFVIGGHVFLFALTNDKDGLLHVFDCVPRAVAGAKELATQPTQLLQSCSGVLDVLELNAEGALRIAVVQRSGELSAYRFDAVTLQWRSLGNERLARCVVCSVAFCPKTNTFVCCEQLEKDEEVLYRVTVRKLEKVDDNGLSLDTPEVVLSGCPPLDVHAMADWVCLVPQKGTPYPANLLLFWCPGQRYVQGCVWNAPMVEPQTFDRADFKSICLHFSSLCIRLQLPREPSLVAVSPNAASNVLLTLGSGGQLTCFSHVGMEIRQSVVQGLSDIPAWFKSLPPFPQSDVRLCTLYTYWCVFSRGTVRVYDSLTGDLVWECDDHGGVADNLGGVAALPWFSRPPLQLAGYLTDQDIWVLKSKQMPTHAQCMIEGYLPVAMDAEETDSGKYIGDSYWLSSQLCQAWGLDLQSTRYCLDAVYSTIKGVDEGTLQDDQSLPYLPQQLVDVLPTMCLQNPSLSVALLVRFPMYRTQLKTQVSNFLDSYKSGQDWLLYTQLNADTVRLLMEFVELCNKYDSILDNCLIKTQQPLSTTRQHVVNILTQAYTTTIVGDDEGSVPFELHSLVHHCPEEVLAGIRSFLGIPSFKQAVEELKVGQGNPQVGGQGNPPVNWRRVFAQEQVRDEAMRGSAAKVPLFEVICRLLYQLEPLELVQFVEFAKLSRAKSEGSYVKDHTMAVLYQRALEAVTPLVSGAPRCHPEAVKEYCQLLLMSQCSRAEMAVTNLLIGQRMWTDAIEFVRELKKKSVDARSSDIYQAVYHLALTSFSEAAILREYLEEMWELVPRHFSVFDFLHILKSSTTQSHSGVFVEGDDDLAVQDVASKLLQLVQTSRIDTHLLDISTVRNKL